MPSHRSRTVAVPHRSSDGIEVALYCSAVRRLVVYCSDIGSIGEGNFAWVRAKCDWRGGHFAYDQEPTREGKHSDIDALADWVRRDLSEDHPVALGFECPLFFPVRKNAEDLTKCRAFEGDRPWSEGKWSWSAAAGAQALVTGLPQVLYLLRVIRRSVPAHSRLDAHLSWNSFKAAGRGLLIWEAFVPGKLKHLAAAKRGIRYFVGGLTRDPEYHGKPVQSLVGGALLSTRWRRDLGVLGEPCIVVDAQ